VACMPNTNPALDDASVLGDLAERIAHDAVVRVSQIGAITCGRKGEAHVDFAALSRAGAVAFSDDGNTVMNARLLRDAALTAVAIPGVFISHAEGENIKGNAVMNEGAVSRALGSSAVPLLRKISSLRAIS
jgi:dihydroorotase